MNFKKIEYINILDSGRRKAEYFAYKAKYSAYVFYIQEKRIFKDRLYLEYKKQYLLTIVNKKRVHKKNITPLHYSFLFDCKEEAVSFAADFINDYKENINKLYY